MFWRKLRPSVSDPDKVTEGLLGVFKRAKTGDMFTLDDLAMEVRAARKSSVARSLGQLAEKHQIDQVVSVISPTGGGIRNFDDITEIPRVLYDPFQLKDIDVEPSMIRIYYTKPRPASETPTLPKGTRAIA